MKCLFVGDIHNHTYIFDDVNRLDNEYNFDKIIFLGDYVDDWGTTNEDSIKTLNKVIELKKSNPNKYTFILGNHELSYLGYPCSGHKFENDNLVRLLLTDNQNVFNYFESIALDETEFICSHAGFTNNYINTYISKYTDEHKYMDILNQMNTNILKYLKFLTPCAKFRGGKDICSSFVWADKNELIYTHLGDMFIPNQIVGHTPVETVCSHSTDTGILYFIDTHSTYRNGLPFGDKSYLMWNETGFKIVY